MGYGYLTSLVIGLFLAADAEITFFLAGDAVSSSDGKIIAAENDKSLGPNTSHRSNSIALTVTWPPLASSS
jgi:hypothetical protein